MSMVNSLAAPQLSDIAEVIAHINTATGGVLIVQTQAHQLVKDNSADQTPSSEQRQQSNSELIDTQPELSHEPSYGDFNLGLHVGDKAISVHQHRSQLLGALNEYLCVQQRSAVDNSLQPVTQLHWLNQVHGKQVLNVDSRLNLSAVDADAMISQTRGTGLAIMTADCVPIVLYQPASGKIAAIHAGWQGLAQGVIKAAHAHFQPASEVYAWIGACISQANYQVGAEVVKQLLDGCLQHQLVAETQAEQLMPMIATATRPAIAASEPMQSQTSAKYWLDLVTLSQLQLQHLNITLGSTSEVACSYADSQRYYSYRRQTHQGRLATGRMALVIVRY